MVPQMNKGNTEMEFSYKQNQILQLIKDINAAGEDIDRKTICNTFAWDIDETNILIDSLLACNAIKSVFFMFHVVK